MAKLYVVATPIGNLSDITHRALEVLRSVGLVAAEDTRRTKGMLAHFDIHVPVISNYKHNEVKRARQLIERMLTENIDVAVVSDAGTPCISDPGGVLVEAAHENGVTVHAIPGASSVTAALSVSGFGFTSFVFMGFVPRVNKERDEFLNIMGGGNFDVYVLFESPNRIMKTLAAVSDLYPGCMACVINDITKFHERTYRGKITDVIEMIAGFPNAHLGEYTAVLKLNNRLDKKDDNNLSVEAVLMDEMVRENLTVKEAAASIVTKGKASRNEAYRAGISIRQRLL
jgi:16S rRNA (cytidine1402-2'-O)-methyltransferase